MMIQNLFTANNCLFLFSDAEYVVERIVLAQEVYDSLVNVLGYCVLNLIVSDGDHFRLFLPPLLRTIFSAGQSA